MTNDIVEDEGNGRRWSLFQIRHYHLVPFITDHPFDPHLTATIAPRCFELLRCAYAMSTGNFALARKTVGLRCPLPYT